MTTRRKFIAQSTIAGVGLSLAGAVPAFAAEAVGRETSALPHIKRVTRRDETLLRFKGSGVIASGGHFTWAADDSQFYSFGDRADPLRPLQKFHHARVGRVLGGPHDPQNMRFEDLPGYPDMLLQIPDDPSGPAAYWGGDCLVVGGVLYQMNMTSNVPYLQADLSFTPGFRIEGTKLIYSTDNGRTWRNQDDSTPAVWEKWDGRSRQNMLFWDEPDSAFMGFNVFLQMGRNYELNRDGYVYMYGSNGTSAVKGASEIALIRVPKALVRDRRAYEYFSGVRAGRPSWAKDIAARAPVHRFRTEKVYESVPSDGGGGAGPWGVSSVVYNAPLGVYMLAGSGGGANQAQGWKTKPRRRLGFWISSHPWGPFTQIHEEEWLPENDRDALPFAPRIAPKWISQDGKSFWLSWGDYRFRGKSGEDGVDEYLIKSFIEKNKRFNSPADVAAAVFESLEAYGPYHLTFLMQQFEIETA